MIQVTPLLRDQQVTQKGDLPSQDLVEIIQQLVAYVKALEARVTLLDGGGP
jgi:hypothetical protein